MVVKLSGKEIHIGSRRTMHHLHASLFPHAVAVELESCTQLSPLGGRSRRVDWAGAMNGEERTSTT